VILFERDQGESAFYATEAARAGEFHRWPLKIWHPHKKEIDGVVWSSRPSQLVSITVPVFLPLSLPVNRSRLGRLQRQIAPPVEHLFPQRVETVGHPIRFDAHERVGLELRFS
jgi:hypothetical protein